LFKSKISVTEVVIKYVDTIVDRSNFFGLIWKRLYLSKQLNRTC
jgi:hypothetical protein